MLTYRDLVYFSLICAVSLAFFLGSFVLETLGIQYISEGGSKIFKIHMYSYVILVVFAITALRFGPKNMINELGPMKRYWWLSFSLIFLIIIYGVTTLGLSGLAPLVDTMLIPLLVAPLVMLLTKPQKSKIISFFAWLILLNSFIAITEYFLKKHLFIVLYIDTLQFNYFRAFAFMAHPLNNAMITAALAPILMTSTRVPPPIYFSIVLLALFAFGARAATAVFILSSFALSFEKIKLFCTTGVEVNKKQFAFLYAVFLLASITGFFILIYTSIGDRILDKLYIDGSAKARFDVFFLLEQLSFKEWLFGASSSLLLNIEHFIGIMVIENYVIGWILFFGSIVAVLLLITIFSIPFKAFMIGGAAIKITIFSFALISISNNSLSTKTPALFFLLIIVLCKLGLESKNPTNQPSNTA